MSSSSVVSPYSIHPYTHAQACTCSLPIHMPFHPTPYMYMYILPYYAHVSYMYIHVHTCTYFPIMPMFHTCTYMYILPYYAHVSYMYIHVHTSLLCPCWWADVILCQQPNAHIHSNWLSVAMIIDHCSCDLLQLSYIHWKLLFAVHETMTLWLGWSSGSHQAV